MKDGLYHAELGLPWQLLAPFLKTVYTLQYDMHAQRAALDDRCGALRSVPPSLHIQQAEIFECELLGGRVVKLAVRINHSFKADPRGVNAPLDLVLVLRPLAARTPSLTVTTLWLNRSTDRHSTLNEAAYERVS